MASSLPGLHAISGCDADSVLYGIGKQKVYKVVKGSERYQETLVQLGESLTFNQELFSSLQEMVSECYGLTDTKDVNQACYQKFCSKTKIPELQQLPPTKNEFFLHCQRANYIACIWKSALTVSSTEPDPDGHGWFRSDEGDLSVKWMSQKPAPDSILEFSACGCKKSGCRNNMCICVANGLKRTDICSCMQCSNSQPEQDSPEEYEQYCKTDD